MPAAPHHFLKMRRHQRFAAGVQGRDVCHGVAPRGRGCGLSRLRPPHSFAGDGLKRRVNSRLVLREQRQPLAVPAIRQDGQLIVVRQNKLIRFDVAKRLCGQSHVGSSKFPESKTPQLREAS